MNFILEFCVPFKDFKMRNNMVRFGFRLITVMARRKKTIDRNKMGSGSQEDVI